MAMTRVAVTRAVAELGGTDSLEGSALRYKRVTAGRRRRSTSTRRVAEWLLGWPGGFVRRSLMRRTARGAVPARET